MRKHQSLTLTPSLRPPDTSGQCAPWLEEELQLIESFAGYGDNWDSNQAAAVAPQAVLGAKALLERLAYSPGIASPKIYPTRGGNVQFEWESADRYFEIEIVSPTSLRWLDTERAGAENEGELREVSEIDALLAQISLVHQ